jgi:hypothetical protein
MVIQDQVAEKLALSVQVATVRSIPDPITSDGYKLREGGGLYLNMDATDLLVTT